MNCINCGAFLTDTDLDYCPHCGANVLIQKKVDYLSKLYYNQGLEKASIRDLSGAISCLKQSLASVSYTHLLHRDSGRRSVRNLPPPVCDHNR